MNSNLYLLVFPKLNALKIGKANEVQQRYEQLKSIWGAADLKASYSISIAEENVFKLEKALHFFFQDYNKNYQTGDGHTEFFDLSILDKVLNLLKEIASCSQNQMFSLKKGICIFENTIFHKNPLSEAEKQQQKLNKQHQKQEKLNKINEKNKKNAQLFIDGINQLNKQYNMNIIEYLFLNRKEKYIGLENLSQNEIKYIQSIVNIQNGGFTYTSGGFSFISNIIVGHNKFLFKVVYKPDLFKYLIANTQDKETKAIIKECEQIIQHLSELIE